jgi:hypothetical protein
MTSIRPFLSSIASRLQTSEPRPEATTHGTPSAPSPTTPGTESCFEHQPRALRPDPSDGFDAEVIRAAGNRNTGSGGRNISFEGSCSEPPLIDAAGNRDRSSGGIRVGFESEPGAKTNPGIDV